MKRRNPSNIPFAKHEVEDYERKRYRGIDQRLVDWRERRILGKIFRKTGGGSARLLDLPCGYGRFSRLIVERGFFLVSGDLSFHMVKRAIEKSGQSMPLPGVVADARQGLPFKDGSFHLVLSMRFFHHLHEESERVTILKEFSRISSAWIALSYYQTNWLHSLQRKLRRRIKRSRTRIRMTARREFFKEAGSAGLEVVRSFPLFRGIHSQHIVLLKKK